MAHVNHAQRLAAKAYRVELHRRATPEELKPLTAKAKALINHDRDDELVLRRLERKLDVSPEGQAVNQASGAAKALLGHAPDAALLQQARDLAAQGKTTAEVRSALEASIKAGPEYRKGHTAETVTDAYQQVLERGPTMDEKVDGVKWTHELIDQNKTAEEVSAAWKEKLGGTAEARKLHAADNVNAVYAFTMGRAPTAQELDDGKGLVRQLVDEGKSNDEVNGTLDYLCKLSPEWQAKHPQMNQDRDAIYLHQPNGWTCGPTSLAMAMAAAGKRPANEDTVWEMAQPDKLNTIANHSTDKMPWEIADLARGMGVNAESHTLASAAEIRAGLERGHGMIVNGKLPDTSGHFIYLSGVDAQGQIVVADPWHPDVTRWNDEQLAAFVYGRGNSVEIWP